MRKEDSGHARARWRRVGVLGVASLVGSALAVIGFSAPAFATLQIPGGNFNGSGNTDSTPLRGVVTITETAPGGGNGTFCSGAYTNIAIHNSAGQQVFSASNGGGSLSTQWTTESVPNGSYTITGSWTSTAIQGFSGCKMSGVSTDSVAVDVANIASITYSGPTSAPWGTSITVSAKLMDPSLGQPLPGQSVTFSLSGEQAVTSQTNASGIATTTLAVDPPVRTATLGVSFAGTPYYEAASTSIPFSVIGHPTRLVYTGPTRATWGEPVTLSANLVDAVTGSPIGGDPVKFTIGSQSVTGTTDAAGAATATLVPAQTPSEATCGGSSASEATCISYNVVVSFPGDADYTASSATSPFTIDWQYAFADSTGAGTVYVNPGSEQYLLVGTPTGKAPQVMGPISDPSMTVVALPTGDHVIDVTYVSAPLVLKGDFVEETGQFAALAATTSQEYVLKNAGTAQP